MTWLSYFTDTNLVINDVGEHLSDTACVDIGDDGVSRGDNRGRTALSVLAGMCRASSLALMSCGESSNFTLS